MLLQAFANASLDHQVGSCLLEDAGANAFFNMLAG
jgi:hypothetical protein